MHEPGSMAHLERALAQCRLGLENIRLVVCTHAHSDHYGQAGTIVSRTGCELWMHPAHQHMTLAAEDPDAALTRRLEIARQSGVPEEPLRRYAEARRGQGYGISALVAPDRELLPGVTIDTDLGQWTVHETPGHAPSHVCLYQAERRILISGDHLLGRVSLYYDYGWTPDPAGEFLRSLDVVERLDARLCLAGHGRTFTDVGAHIRANRDLAAQRVSRIEQTITERALTAFEIVPIVYGEPLTAMTANWRLSETLCYLTHLAATARAEPVGEATPGEPQRWIRT